MREADLDGYFIVRSIGFAHYLQPIIFFLFSSPVEIEDVGESAPIKIAFKNAADDLRKVIPLAEVSEEEAARIEKEVLAELQII